MLYYETDFFEFDTKNPVNLVITSPPTVLLDTRMSDIFDRLIPMMNPDGWILWDMPAGYERLVSLYDSTRQRHQWHFAESYLIENMYPGFPAQRLYIIKRVENDVAIPFVPPCFRLKCDKFQPSHYCEFNPKLIHKLITHYSQLGDCVFDPFAGTGTVPRIACELSRVGIGIEIKKELLCPQP